MLNGRSRQESTAVPFERQQPTAATEVDLVQPRAGGIPREITQTGTIEAYEVAELTPRVSGYVRKIAFQIGDYVSQGQLVAEIDAEELLKDVEKHSAILEQSHNRVLQNKAQLKAAIADLEAAEGKIGQVQAEVRRNEAQLALRHKEMQRIQDLIDQHVLEVRIGEETRYQVEAAEAGVEEARASEAVAKSELRAIESRIEIAKANILAAESDVRVATADLGRAKVMSGYMQIYAPFAGVITARNFDRGDYVHAASSRGGEPILTIAQTDRMRTVMQVPAPDVPFVRPGQTANVAVNALGGRIFKGTISRIAHHQDRRTRTMRVEVDLPNSKKELASGMYGAVTIEVPAPHDVLTLPSECMVGRTVNGQGRVYVLEEGHLELRTIGVGRSNKERFEVLDGVTASTAVVTRAIDGILGDGFEAIAGSTLNETSETQLAAASADGDLTAAE